MPPALLSRRDLLLAALAASSGLAPAWALPPRMLQFPRDFGSHPELRTEWWYITGHAQAEGGRAFGFQVTFFRSRVDPTQGMRSKFAAQQLVFAHAAVTDLEGRALRHDQRIARAGLGGASASETDTALRLRDWSLLRGADGYTARIPASGFTLELRFAPTQPVLLQGRAGVGLGDVVGVGPRRLPRPCNDLRLAEHGAELVDHGGLDLARGDAADRARPGTVLQHSLTDIVAV